MGRLAKLEDLLCNDTVSYRRGLYLLLCCRSYTTLAVYLKIVSWNHNYLDHLTNNLPMYRSNLFTVLSEIRFDKESLLHHGLGLTLIHISEPTRLGMISYAVFCLK